MNDLQMRTWAEISLPNIEHNFNAMKARLRSGTRFLGIVKADAYGTGPSVSRGSCRTSAATIWAWRASTRRLTASGERHHAACPDHGLHAGPVYRDAAPEQPDADGLQPRDGRGALPGGYGAGRDAEGSSQGGQRYGTPRLHLPRGRDPEAEMARALGLPGLYAEGIFSHFAVADLCGDDYTERQYQAFSDLVDRLEQNARDVV